MAAMIGMCGKSDVANRLRLALTVLDLKQADVAKLFSLDRTKLNHWITGDHFPSPPFLAELCDRYGLTMDWFYRGVTAGVRHDLAEALLNAGKEQHAALAVTGHAA